MSLGKRSEWMKGCGKTYKTAADAERSKDVLQNGHEVVRSRCPGCEGFHTRPPARTDGGGKPRSFAARRVAAGFPASVKLAARARAGGGDPEHARCEAGGEWLGLSGGDIHHRDPRGMGGSTDAVVNGISNAAVLCRRHHDLCEARDRRMGRRGWWIGAGTGPEYDPRFVPVRLWPGHGHDRPVYLTEDGSYSEDPPGEVAA